MAKDKQPAVKQEPKKMAKDKQPADLVKEAMRLIEPQEGHPQAALSHLEAALTHLEAMPK